MTSQTPNPNEYTNQEADSIPVSTVAADPSSDTSGLIFVTKNDFDPMYSESEINLVKAFITKQAKDYGINLDTPCVPASEIAKRKRNGIYSAVLILLFFCALFFHLNKFILFLFIIPAIILKKRNKKFSMMDYLVKEVKSHPSEKVSTVIYNAKNSLVPDSSRKFGHIARIIALVVVLVVFRTPKMFYTYDSANEGYYVSRYIAGYTNYSTIEIPEDHDGEPVVGIRGDVFNNLFMLETVIIPDTVVDIRGHAFENDSKLSDIDLPKNLTRIGGSAFEGCSSLTSISIPDTVVEIEGEAFKGCSDLRKVSLSANITEIRGNTFEDCTSLKSINIPYKVTRIGGHAFYNNTSLSSVTIESGSKLNEIGSSAFRNCTSLKSITLPKGVSVNEKAFKESPTKISYTE